MRILFVMNIIIGTFISLVMPSASFQSLHRQNQMPIGIGCYYDETQKISTTIVHMVANPTLPSSQHVNEDKSFTEVEQKILINEDKDIKDDKDSNIFDVVAGSAAMCLFESDLRHDANSTATNWINDASAFALQNAVDKIKLKLAEERTGVDRDEASSWIRWMKSTPTTLILDLSEELRSVASSTISEKKLEMIEQTPPEFLSRMGCRLILLPSGLSVQEPLLEPPASLIYGKLLYGGATRYRRLASAHSNRPPRRAAEKTTIKITVTDDVPAWLQYGGAKRMYEAVDIGSAAILEVILLRRGQELPPTMGIKSDMVMRNIGWKPQDMFDIISKESNDAAPVDGLDFVTGYTPISMSGKERNEAFESDFKSSLGGLGKEIDSIVRRVLDGRVLRPAQEEGDLTEDETTACISQVAMEAEELAVLGLTPVRGLLLYGPPGCGKTALAREISKALRARTPKIVSAPELLDRWVGGSEKLVRGLFADAEAELASCNGDPTRSALHVIVIDEIDAVFRRRSSAEDSGEATRASVVNQILAKLDGIKAISNILLIGMTNRRELLDEALLRPGRLEVQIEIPLPDRDGRREILQIHFDALRNKGRLSKPLCCAIDGVPINHGSHTGSFENKDSLGGDDLPFSARRSGGKRQAVKRVLKRVISEANSVVRPTYDLAADSETGGFSGADIAGLVRCAGSSALSRARKDGSGVDGLLITLEDVKQALLDVKG